MKGDMFPDTENNDRWPGFLGQAGHWRPWEVQPRAALGDASCPDSRAEKRPSERDARLPNGTGRLPGWKMRPNCGREKVKRKR